MEERYDEDTVELIDYLRVMWWGKWIILGCLVVAVGLSVLLVGLKPVTTTYSGSMEFLLRDYVTAAFAGNRDATAAMTDAVALASIDVETAVPGIEGGFTEDRITLSRSNVTSADAVREALAQAKVVLEEHLPLALAEELDYLAKVMQLNQNSQLAQLDILQQRLSEKRDSEGPMAVALAGQTANLETRIAQQQVSLDMLATNDPSDLYVLTLIGEPTITATTAESKLKTTIAVAGFLGLMIGVLLAFFVHYLVQIRERERSSKASDE